jgi:hypothetical protein
VACVAQQSERAGPPTRRRLDAGKTERQHGGKYELAPLPDSCIGSRWESRVISVLLRCASIEERLVREM